jgi:hypothetical protein
MFSAVHPITDITKLERHVRKVPTSDIADATRGPLSCAQGHLVLATVIIGLPAARRSARPAEIEWPFEAAIVPFRNSYKFSFEYATVAISVRFQHGVNGHQAISCFQSKILKGLFGGSAMSKFIIEPHFRLQEWVAEEKGYFLAEGLEYEFRELIRSTDGQHHNKVNQGAFQSIEKGREADVSCACHWTVNVAASNGHTKLYADVYSVAPSGIFVAADSSVRTPADLADVAISVGFQSGSHYSTIQALEQYMPSSKINLTFEDGMLFRRMELLIEGKSPAAALFNGPYYLAEQLGFRKVIDTTFMIAAMIKGAPDPEDIRRYFRALRKAQRDIDLRPELYTHYYKNEFPDRFHAVMDPRRWGPGERIVFEPYSREVFKQSFDWIERHGIFSEGRMGSGDYDQATISFAAG